MGCICKKISWHHEFSQLIYYYLYIERKLEMAWHYTIMSVILDNTKKQSENRILSFFYFCMNAMRVSIIWVLASLIIEDTKLFFAGIWYIYGYFMGEKKESNVFLCAKVEISYCWILWTLYIFMVNQGLLEF